MNISDLYDDEFYEEKKYIIDKIATFIKEDGFDISSFSFFFGRRLYMGVCFKQ